MVDEKEQRITTIDQLKKLANKKELAIRINTSVGGGHGNLDMNLIVEFIPTEYRCWRIIKESEERWTEEHLSELAFEEFSVIPSAIKKMGVYLDE